MTDEIMSFKEAMSYLKIPRSTLYKLVQEQRVPAIKVGRHWRFSKNTLDKWISGDSKSNSMSDVGNNQDNRQYCWQTDDRKLTDDHHCVQCLTYRVRALNCFLLRNVVDSDLILCDKECRECEYFMENFD